MRWTLHELPSDDTDDGVLVVDDADDVWACVERGGCMMYFQVFQYHHYLTNIAQSLFLETMHMYSAIQ